jgi:chromosomal replication initiator protein
MAFIAEMVRFLRRRGATLRRKKAPGRLSFMPTRSTFGRFLATPENRAGLLAVQDLLFDLTSRAKNVRTNLVFLHGPTGAGKSLLVQTLVQELAISGIAAMRISANDFAGDVDLRVLSEVDLLIVEDLQHLPTRAAPSLIRLIDTRLQYGLPMIFTALVGPGRLKHRGVPLPHRLTSRLGSGLVVGVEPMQEPSRRRLLKALAEDAKVTIDPEILAWLAEQLTGGGRQLEGAIRQLKALQRLQAKPLRLADVQVQFRTLIDAKTPTVKRIAEHVSGYFRVAPKQVVSARRSREVLLPRQIGMYLARQLTDLSFEKIGKYFGGRDHKTVQHACRKVEAAMKTDAQLSGAVRQMHAELA